MVTESGIFTQLRAAVSYHRSCTRGHMPLTLKTINAELAKRGHKFRVERGSGYFYFWTGEAADRLDKTVRVPAVGSLTLEQWTRESRRFRSPGQAAVPVAGINPVATLWVP